MNKIITIIMGMLTGSVYAQTGSISAAQDAAMFAPAVNSEAINILSQLFAGIMDINGGNPLESLIQSFNAVVLIIAGIVITYQIMNGLIATAHEGEFLGKKLNAATYPLRIAIASAIIVPIKGGYAIIQMVVMWLVIQSIGFADQAWIKYVEKENFNKTMQVKPASPQSKQMVRNVFESLICTKTLSAISNDPKNNLGVVSDFRYDTVKDDDISRRIAFGNFNYTHGFGHDQCGIIEIKRVNNLESKIGGASGTIDTGIISDTEGSMLLRKIQTVVNLAHRQATDELIKDLEPAADKVVAAAMAGGVESINSIGNIDTLLLSASNKYNNKLTDAVSEQLKGDNLYNEIREKAISQGFVSSMFMFNKMTHLADVVGRSVSTDFGYTQAKPISNQLYADQYSTNISKIKTYMSTKTSNSLALTSTTMTNGVDDNQDMNFIQEMFSEHLHGGMFMIYPDEHPLMAAKRIGNNILNGLSGLTVAALLAKAASFIPGVGGIVGGTVSGIIQPILYPIWATALPLIFFLLVVIPLTPILYILGSIIGWVVSVVEAVIIAPFWAVMHIVHGDDLLGSGERGYKLLVNILMKPILIIVGVISSYVLVGVISSYINASYADIMNALKAGSTGIMSSVFYWFVSIAIIMVINFTIMMTLLKLIFQLPDRIMQWITNSENTLGGSAQDLAGAAGGTAKVTSGGLALAGKGIAGNIQNFSNKLDESKKLKEQEASMSGVDKLQKNMKDSDGNYGSNDSFGSVKALNDVKNMEQQLNAFDSGLGGMFATAYNDARGEDGNSTDHATAFQSAFNNTFKDNFEATSPEAKFLSSISSDPKSAMTGIQALSKLKQFGENRGMLSNDINNSISSFASNVAKETNDFKEGNISEVIGKEYYKTKNSMSGAM